MRHEVVRTPIDTLNVLGAGGIKRGSILQIYGTAGSGKSTFCYQTASMDLVDNEDCVLDIIDVENSADIIRLVHAFKLDMDRVTIHHMPTLEAAFKLVIDSADRMTEQRVKKIKLGGRKEIKLSSKDAILKMEDKEFFDYCSQFEIPLPPTMENGVTYESIPIVPEDYDNDRTRMMKALARAGGYYLIDNRKSYATPRNIIWDTIAVSRPMAELEKIAEGDLAKNAAGMNVAAQVISTKLSACLSSMGGKPLTLFLPNQVRNKAKQGGMVGFEQGFAGSYALEHNCHYILRLKKVNNADSRAKNYDEGMGMKTGTDFRMTIEKTKFCPATQSVNLYINDQKGGIIIANEELAHVALEIGLMSKSSGWYTIKNHEDLGKFRWDKKAANGDNYISGNAQVRRILMEELARHYRTSYKTLDILYRESGKDDFGKPFPEDTASEESIQDEKMLDSMQEKLF